MASKYHGRIHDLPLDVENNFIPKSEKRIVYGPDTEGRESGGFVMRNFIMEVGSMGGLHAHQWPHWMYCLRGKGLIHIEGDVNEEFTIEAGEWCFIPGGPPHYFGNASDAEEFEFFCIVPPEGDVNPLKKK